jgi:phenylpropionate dioxygenase-like ring-hydroxylating dioxygenase large terminal subunit
MSQPFLRNTWYVAAWDHEIPAEGLFSRTVIGEPLLIYRTSDGRIAVLEDRCCHRQAPLSLGRREGDCVRCGYHGLKFAADGRCVEVPGQDVVPPKARVRAFPAVLRHRWLMVWMGDQALADPALLPDNFSNDHPDWRCEPGYLHYATPWQLIADNLLDFSHLSYVHAATLGGSEQIAHLRPTVEVIERGIRVKRRVPGVPSPSYYKPLWDYAGPIDRWIDYDFLLPATLLMHSGARPAGAPEADDAEGVRFHSCQALTPETEHSTHYFFQEAHRAGQGDAQVTHGLHAGLLAAFEEDRAMITAQSRNIALQPHRPMLPLAMDLALTQFRRLMAQAVQAEAKPAAEEGVPGR